MHSTYLTFFGGSFRTAQHTDMMEKKEKHMSSTYVTLFGGSFRTAQLTDMRKKSEHARFF